MRIRRRAGNGAVVVDLVAGEALIVELIGCPSAQREVIRWIPYPEDVCPCALAIVVRVDVFEVADRFVFLREPRKVCVIELIQVDVAGVKVDESPTIKSGDLNVAKLAPVGRKVPLLDESTAEAARIVDVTLSDISIRVIDGEVATLLVGTNHHQFQLAREDVDITQADVKYVPVEVTRTSIYIEGEIVEANIVAPKVPGATFDSAEIGDRQAADAQIDVVGAAAKSR